MNVIKSNDIYLKGTKRAILFLHSFTSSAKEMRGLAKHLHKKGYTCYAPNLKGHGETPAMLFETSMEEMWETAKYDFRFLQSEGYENIIVIGQSLGGVMALRLAMNRACQAVVVMSAPLKERPIESLENRIRSFTKRYYYSSRQSEESLESFIKQHFPRPIAKLRALQQFLLNTQEVLPSINKPICLVKGALDADVYKDSIDLIEETVKSLIKKKLTYSNSGHLVTIDKDRNQLYEDIQLFIEKINNDD